MTFQLYIPVLPRPRGSAALFVHEVKEGNHIPKQEILFSGHWHAEVDFFFPFLTTGDIDNLLKPTLDLLKGTVLKDDRQIKKVTATMHENSGKAGFSFLLTEMPRKLHIYADMTEKMLLAIHTKQKIPVPKNPNSKKGKYLAALPSMIALREKMKDQNRRNKKLALQQNSGVTMIK